MQNDPFLLFRILAAIVFFATLYAGFYMLKNFQRLSEQIRTSPARTRVPAPTAPFRSSSSGATSSSPAALSRSCCTEAGRGAPPRCPRLEADASSLPPPTGVTLPLASRLK